MKEFEGKVLKTKQPIKSITIIIPDYLPECKIKNFIRYKQKQIKENNEKN